MYKKGTNRPVVLIRRWQHFQISLSVSLSLSFRAELNEVDCIKSGVIDGVENAIFHGTLPPYPPTVPLRISGLRVERVNNPLTWFRSIQTITAY